jgi:hypothetical protein
MRNPTRLGSRCPSGYWLVGDGLVSFTVFMLAIWLSRGVLFRVATDLWIVSDTVSAAEAVAVLGGGLKTRALAAAEYYRKGLVQRILISNVGHGNTGTLNNWLQGLLQPAVN